MTQEYINYIKTENLIRLWPVIQGIKESLTTELINHSKHSNQGEADDYIYTQVVGNKVLSDTPPSGKISDSTGDTAIRYRSVMNRDTVEPAKQIQRELMCVNLVDDKLSIAFRRLSNTQEMILRMFYLENKTWSEVLDELKRDKCFISKQQAQRIRRDGVYKVQRISKIKLEAYLEVIRLVEVEL